jgi:hypothetical protein
VGDPHRNYRNNDGRKLDWTRKASESEIKLINKALDDFEAIFSSESQSLEVFSIPQKQAYSTTTLIEHGEQILPEGTRKQLSRFTVNEISEATRCIVFDLPTAGGFHLLRGLESAVRDYYDKLSGGAPRPKFKNGNDASMGDYIVELEKLNAGKELTETLRQIKKLHRDQHMHPESVFKDGEDVVLLGLVTSAIWAMFK